MRLVFNRCHGESPTSCGPAEWGEPCEFPEVESFINGSLRFVNHAYASSLRATAPTLDKTCTTSAGALKLASALTRPAGYPAKSLTPRLGQWCLKPDLSIGVGSARQARENGSKGYGERPVLERLYL